MAASPIAKFTTALKFQQSSVGNSLNVRGTKGFHSQLICATYYNLDCSYYTLLQAMGDTGNNEKWFWIAIHSSKTVHPLLKECHKQQRSLLMIKYITLQWAWIFNKQEISWISHLPPKGGTRVHVSNSVLQSNFILFMLNCSLKKLGQVSSAI